MLSRSTELVIGVVVTAIVMLISPKGKRAPSLLGCMITFIGVVSLIEGRLAQFWQGGPPVEGSLAKLFSVILIGVGLYIISLAFRRTLDGPTKKDNNQQT